MTPIMLGQESVRNCSTTKHKPPTTAASTASPLKIRKQILAAPCCHRPPDILVLPRSPLAEDIVIVRRAQEAAFLPSPRLRHNPQQQQRMSIRPKSSSPVAAQKRPRILLSTKNFKWVKTDDAVWVKVPVALRKRRIVLKMKEKEKRMH